VSIIKMVGSTTGSSAVVSAVVDIPADGWIYAISHGITVLSNATPATGDQVLSELTFNNAPSFGVNDARGAMCTVSHTISFADAARVVPGGVPSCWMHALKYKVNAGERLFLISQATQADIAYTAAAYIYIDDKIDSGRVMQRRR
jgi:hypothetical protein